MLVASTTFCPEAVGSSQVLRLSQAIHPPALIFVSHRSWSPTAVAQTLAVAKANTWEGLLSRVISHRKVSYWPGITGGIPRRGEVTAAAAGSRVKNLVEKTVAIRGRRERCKTMWRNWLVVVRAKYR
jgi:hypothetical protein